MLREERHEKILELLEKSNIVKVSDLSQELNATEMTLRRDLKYLEDNGLLVRIHGGAKKNDSTLLKELSQIEKREINVDKKIEAAKVAASLINENDIVYIGPGTTCELIYDYIQVPYIKVFTNSLAVFEKFKNDDRREVILVGGEFRPKTQAFIGDITNDILSKQNFKIAFVGTNGVFNNKITMYNEDEGICQRIALENSWKKYIICDSSKLGKEDFYKMYDIDKTSGLVTDSSIDMDLVEKHCKNVNIINTVQK